MIAHTHGFKTAMSKLGRDINVLIDYYAVVYNLKTEDNKLLITQDNAEILTENMPIQEPTSQLTNADIISLNRNNLGELFRTYMKSFDLETTHKFNVGDKMIIKVGTTVNGEIEYLNYGLYYVYERTYKEDSKTYTYTLCDRMLFAMQKYDNTACFGNSTQLTCKQLITNILTNICGFDSDKIQLNDSHLVNRDKIIYKDTFEGADMTCRDVLDMIMQVQGCSLVIGFSEHSENLFDKDNANVINGYIQGASGKIIGGNSDKCIYIPCKPNTTYKIQRAVLSGGNRLRVGSSSILPDLNVILDDYIYSTPMDASLNVLYTTTSNAEYLVVYFYNNNSPYTFSELSATLQIEQSKFDENIWGGFSNTHTTPVMKTSTDGTISIISSGTASSTTYSITSGNVVSKGIYKTLEAGTYIISSNAPLKYRLQAIKTDATSLAQTTTTTSIIEFTLTETTNVCIRLVIPSGITYEPITIYPHLQQIVPSPYVPYSPDYDYICTKKISTSTVDTIDSDILNDKNIDMGEKYGKLNSLLFSRADGVDNIERKNTASIEEYGETQYVIENNYILDQDNRESYIDNLFLAINGIEYYICDIEIKGLGYIEYLDRFKIDTGENIYNTICLKNTSTISNGMKEHFKTQELVETKQTFENIGMSDKEASVVVNKLKGEIVLKTYIDEGDGKTKLAQVRLDSSGEEGSLVEIDADTINFDSHEFNLTTDNMTIKSTKFEVDNNGNLECNDAVMNDATMHDATINDATINRANIVGGEITLSTQQSIPKFFIYGSDKIFECDNTGFYITQNDGGQSGEDYAYFTDYAFVISDKGDGLGNEQEIYGSCGGSYPYIKVQQSGSSYCQYRPDGQHPTSDRRCKDNIEEINENQSVNIITKLKPVTFIYKGQKEYHRGLIAQDVKEVLNGEKIENQVYYYNKEDDIYLLNYSELIPDLINCVKYQQKEIENLKKEIENLKGGNK